MEKYYKSANGLIERTRFWVGDNAQPRRKKQKGNTTFRKQEQNFNTALRKVARILNCNYSHENGLLLTLDLDEFGLESLISKLSPEQQSLIRSLKAPVGEIGTWSAKAKKKLRKAEQPTTENKEQTRDNAEAEALDALRAAVDHQVTLWLRRIKRKHEGKIKALIIVSDMDHETGELVRCHAHIVLGAEDLSWDLLRKEWKLGSVDIRQLRNQPDYTPIATYLMRQVRRQPEKKKYRVTQGMQMPETWELEILTHAEIKAPAGATVFERSEFSLENIGQYIRYLPKKREYRRKRTAEWKEDHAHESE